MAQLTINLRVPEEMAVRFDELAHARGLDRDYVMMDALHQYLEAAREDQRLIRESIAEIDRGEFATAEEIEAEDIAWLESYGYTPEQIAALDQRVDEELRAHYGVAPCA